MQFNTRLIKIMQVMRVVSCNILCVVRIIRDCCAYNLCPSRWEQLGDVQEHFMLHLTKQLNVAIDLVLVLATSIEDGASSTNMNIFTIKLVYIGSCVYRGLGDTIQRFIFLVDTCEYISLTLRFIY